MFDGMPCLYNLKGMVPVNITAQLVVTAWTQHQVTGNFGHGLDGSSWLE